MITTHTHCRACSSRDLETILQLGDLALSTFLAPDDPAPPRAPLNLLICGQCNLVQLQHSVEVDQLFRQYWYKSGINESMRAELADIVEQAQLRLGTLGAGDLVIDIGANDGTLLEKIGKGPLRIAFEPAYNLIHDLREHAEVLIPDYFPRGLREIAQPANLITSIACFYDLDDPHSFVAGIKKTLAPDGLWIVQFQDLLQMLQATAFDNIVHEHVTYPTVSDLQRLALAHGLEVVDAERRSINGGSVRLYVRHAGVQAPTPRINELVQLESQIYHELQQFSWRVSEVKKQLTITLAEAAEFGPVDCYGASTKFSTLAQYRGIGPQLIRQCVERSPEKWGRKTVTGIPIVSEEAWRADPPHATLMAIWQHRDFVLLREAQYLAEGGSFIVPLPAPEVVYSRLTPLEEAI